MLQIESIIIMAILVTFLLLFILFFIIIAISIIKGFKLPSQYYVPIEIEKLSCPKCSSKELEVIGYRTIRCKKCGFIFSIGSEIIYPIWFPWIFFWPLWFPIIFFKEK